MLDFMRRNARSWGIKVALGAIVIVFVFFMGGGGQIGGGPPSVATVGGIAITMPEFSMAQSRNESYFRSQFQGQLTADMLKSLDIPGMTLRQLVDGAALRAEAERLGLSIPDEAVRDALRRVPSFQAGGTFSPSVYRDVIRAQGMTPSQFEANVRRDLLEAQLADIIRRGAWVSEEQAWQEYQARNRKMTLSYVAVPSTPYQESAEAGEEAVAAYFEGKREKYRQPASVKVRYLSYTVEDIAAKVEVDDDEIEAYYDLHGNAEFRQEEQVAARHILKRVGEDDDEETKKAAREAIEDIARRLADGSDFEELAREESDDPGSAVKGGDLGAFGKGRMVPPFEAAAFALAPGQLSEIVETDFGFHVIQVYDKFEAGVQPLEKVRDRVRDIVARRKAADVAFEDSASDASALVDGATMDTIAAERGMKIEETPLFSQGDIVPGIGPAPAFVSAALALAEPGDVSSAVKVGDNWYVLALAERKESYIPELSDVREAVDKDFRREAAIELARKRADELIESLRFGMKLQQLADQDGLTVEKLEEVTVDSQVLPGVGMIPGLVDVAFRTKADGEVLARSFVSGDRAFVFVRDSVTDPDRTAFDAEKEDLIDELREEREQAALQEFLVSLKEREKITYNMAALRPILGDRAPTGQ